MSPFDKLREAADSMRQNIKDQRFSPHIEQDVCGFIYYYWVNKYADDLKLIHLNARVNGYGDSRQHADFAYGEEGTSPQNRLWIERPLLVAEVKSFRGFTSDQKATRWRRLRGDIKKRLDGDIQKLLGPRLPEEVQRCAVVLNWDIGGDYLGDEHIKELRQSAKGKVRMVLISEREVEVY